MNAQPKFVDESRLKEVLDAQSGGDIDAATELCAALLEDYPDSADVHYLYGTLRFGQREDNEAVRYLEKAIALQNRAFYIKNLGDMHAYMMAYDKAIPCYERWAMETLDGTEPHLVLAQVYALMDKPAQQWRWLAEGLQRDYEAVALWEELARQHLIRGYWPAAEIAWRIVRGLNPAHPLAEAIIQGTLMLQGKSPHDTSGITPGSVILESLRLGSKDSKRYQPSGEAFNWLASVLQKQARQDLPAAMRLAQQLTTLYPKQDVFWLTYSTLFQYKGNFTDDARIRKDVVSMLHMPRVHFITLQSGALVLVLRNPLIRRLNKGTAPLTAKELGALASDAILLALLERVVLANLDLENLMIRARAGLLALWQTDGLTSLSPDARALLSALAMQCFQNEYLYDVSASEAEALPALRRAAQAITEFSSANRLTLTLLACYEPLHQHSQAAVWHTMAAREKPSRFRAVLEQQIIEVATEKALRDSIPSLVPIEDATSKKVQAQYEHNPYPRWRDMGRQVPVPFLNYLKANFPHAPIEYPSWTGQLKFLNAGCGTGQHALQSASLYKDGHITAVDLSRTSLAYAMRKAKEYNVKNVQFYHGDILRLAQLTERFHVIESAGVLHHMHDPMAGWRVLRGLLQPQGFMYIGLYSTHARTVIHNLRASIDPKAVQTPEQIRRLRKEHSARLVDTWMFNSSDFYSLSGVRDLLFHVQEHTFTLPQIQEALDSLRLRLIGLSFLVSSPLVDYFRAYPDDPAAINLTNWQEFEVNHPETFRNMYQFWVQAID